MTSIIGELSHSGLNESDIVTILEAAHNGLKDDLILTNMDINDACAERLCSELDKLLNQ